MTSHTKDPSKIRSMFGEIASTYDLLNHLLSANRDRAWRRFAIRFAEIRPEDRLLDVCTGTGDLALEAAHRVRADSGGTVVGTDFCLEMVRIARAKEKRGASRNGTRPRGRSLTRSRVVFALADTLRLPFPDNAFDAVAVGFGIRNLADIHKGLREMRRVLRYGGKAVILEFTSPPANWFHKFFRLYFHHVVPRIGRWISSAAEPRRHDAYSYLPESVGLFPDAEGFSTELERAGFEGVRYRHLTFGIATVHTGRKT